MGRRWNGAAGQGARGVGKRRCEGNDLEEGVEGLAMERVSRCVQKLRTLERTQTAKCGSPLVIYSLSIS